MESSAFKEAFEEIRKLSMDPDTVQLAVNREIALRDTIQRLEDTGIRGKEQTNDTFLITHLTQSIEASQIVVYWYLLNLFDANTVSVYCRSLHHPNLHPLQHPFLRLGMTQIIRIGDNFVSMEV